MMNKDTTLADYELIKKVEKTAAILGLKLVPSKYNDNTMSLVPSDDNLPIWSREYPVFTGSLNYLLSTMYGWQMARTYYTNLRVITPSKVKKAEDTARHAILIDKLKSCGDK